MAATVEVSITGIAHGGDGVGRLPDGMAVFVPGALPGELVEVEVTTRKARFARGRPVAVLGAAPGRAAPPCPHVARGCGGCDVQHATPETQRALKTRIVAEQLARLGRVADAADLVRDCLPVGPDAGYRTRARLHADATGALGYRREGSHTTVAVDDCLVLHPAVQALRDAVGDTTGAAAVELRAHASTGTACVTLSPGPGPLDVPDGAFDVVLEQPDGSTIAVRGDGVLAEQVAGITYRFDATSFFQVNTGGAEALVEHVAAALGDVSGALLWDLYAGVGLFAVPLARAGAEVIAVEGHEPAARWATRNAEDAGVSIRSDARPVDAAVREALASPMQIDHPDLVVLDPPRTGAGAAVITGLAEMAVARVVYVACDPAALARDVGTAAAHGYRLRWAQPLDLFPHTHHVETVALLER